MNKLLNIQNQKHIKLIEKIRSLIKDSAFENHVFIVGGFVRDSIMGNESHDIDIAVDVPDGGISFATWLAYHTGCLISEKNPCVFKTYGTAKMQILTDADFSGIEIECVQTRKEKYDRNSRNPSTAFGTIHEDAMRRDLTINALYYNISTDEIHDFTGKGIEDIKNHVICTTDDADAIFEDDPLRILRTIRYSSKYNWGIEKNTWLGMIKNAGRINLLTQERITDELNKILLTETPSIALQRMSRCNVLFKVLPFLEMSKHVFQDLRPQRTLYDHILDVVDKVPATLECRLAALFHDIGKIKTYNKQFLFHSQVGADMAETVLKAMKYPNHVIKVVKIAIENHEDFSGYRGNSIPRPQVIRKFVSKFENNEPALEVCLNLIHANNISQMYGKKIKQIPGIREKIKEMDKKQESGKQITLPVNGNDVMQHLKLRPSPLLGAIMKQIKDKAIEDPSLTKEEALKIAEKYIEKVV